MCLMFCEKMFSIYSLCLYIKNERKIYVKVSNNRNPFFSFSRWNAFSFFRRMDFHIRQIEKKKQQKIKERSYFRESARLSMCVFVLHAFDRIFFLIRKRKRRIHKLIGEEKKCDHKQHQHTSVDQNDESMVSMDYMHGK